MRSLVLVAVTGCATVPNTCPVGAKLAVEQRPSGRIEYCQATDGSTVAIPTSGRGYESKLGTVVKPGGMPGGVEGPFSQWHQNGQLAMRGAYRDLGARSVPDGVWRFWDDQGKPRLVGRYHRGEPDGCFAVWDHGQRKTGTVKGDELHVESCMPPDETTSSGPARTRFDIQLQGMFGPNRLGIANPMHVEPDPTMTAATGLATRAHLGRLRLGAVGGFRIAGNSDYRSVAFGAVAGWALPKLHRRVESELAVELAVQHITASDVERRGRRGFASLGFWSPLPALQLDLAIALSPSMQGVIGGRIDGLPARDVERTTVYCDLGCTEPIQETWTIGGVSYGVAVGVRFLIQ